jgi:hypothetical protein
VTFDASSSLLTEAPIGRHFAQFHRQVETLSESVFQFLEAGLRRGNSVLMIAPRDHADQLVARLTASQFHPQALCNAGQLGILDAAKTMEQCTIHGVLEWRRFRAALTPVLARIQPFGRGTRIYSEMASMLWQDEDTVGAIRLEEQWNALADTHQFSLYCGYTMDTHCERSYASPLEELGRTHSDILGTPEDERFGMALDRASKEIFGISLSQMAGVAKQDGTRRFPSGQRIMLWVKRNLPMSTTQLAERARHYFQDAPRNTR